MGMWEYGPFDNDTAADYAADLRDMDSPAARVEHIFTTLTQILDEKLTPADLSVYSMGWRLEQAVAAAAVVADAHQGEMRFTDTPYARGVDDDKLGDPPDIGVPQPALVDLAPNWITSVCAEVAYMRGIMDAQEMDQITR